MATPEPTAEPAPSPVEAEVIAQAKAGADLYWAMYHVEKDLAHDMLRSDSVARAYSRAQEVFGPTRPFRA